MAINTKKPATFGDAEIEAFQDKNKSRGEVQKVQYPSDVDPAKPATFWVVKPNREQISIITDVASKSTLKGNDLLINTCVLAGDLDQLQDDDSLYFGLLETVSGLMDAKKKL